MTLVGSTETVSSPLSNTLPPVCAPLTPWPSERALAAVEMWYLVEAIWKFGGGQCVCKDMPRSSQVFPQFGPAFDQVGWNERAWCPSETNVQSHKWMTDSEHNAQSIRL